MKGMCCNGVAGATSVAVGDEVFGVAPGCFGPSVIVPQQLMVHKPPSISFEEAATTPTVYVTVFAAFGDLDTFHPSTKVGMPSPPI